MIYNWLRAVELMCPLQIVSVPSLKNQDEDAMATLQTPPPGWNMEADEELAQFLVTNGAESRSGGVSGRGKGREHFVDITVSSEESEVDNILDPDPEVYWESDGSAGQHWVRFTLVPGTIIERFALIVDSEDGSYLPRRVVVKAGSSPSTVTMIHAHSFGLSDYEKKELQLFPVPLQEFKEVVEVHFKSCYQGGIDVRIRGVSLTSKTAESIFLPSETVPRDIFTEDRVSRCPKLQGFEAGQLFHRGLVLSRLAYILDQDLTYLLPSWEVGLEGAKSEVTEAVSAIRQLWPMSRRRNALISDMLSATATSAPSRPTVYIDRMSAKRHQENPSEDKEGKRTVFIQLQRELKKHTKESNYNFRWAGQWSQWWESKFAQEGMIDQGGGFRDVLSDVAEELCPSSPDAPVPLPLFIRSPNQNQDSSNAYRDNYIPNPKCDDFSRYVFAGQLMGAMLRSQEHLVLSLPQFLWKELVGEPVTWSRDFVSVDSAEVRFIESVETISRERFDDAFAGALRFV
ncbi:E3 ubiquitin-protein ligase HECTD3 [Geodia barretti]|uniref:E3 ubiquitin-protein ligase HECTD3 n=1 Tax=Geodia barretti TaxID=519541 RepID=A0AA35RCQ9_GEOBA|nr:E3 ubiquitin-protein ligase HECTD3 [Geodia barretti]